MNMDNKITQALQEAGKDIEADEWLLKKIKTDIYKENKQKEQTKMKKKHIKWVAVGAVLFMTSTAAYAVGNLTNFQEHSYHDQDIKQPPSVSLLNEKVGYAPHYVEKFSNGWSFKSASIIENSGSDQDGVTTQEWKTVDFNYTKKEVQDGWLSLTTSNISPSGNPTGETLQLNAQQGAVEGIYSEQKYKFVPPNYELTEADEIAEANGSLAISYGSDKITEETMRTLSWKQNGIVYQLITNYTELERNDLLAMAEEVLAQK